jgi:hypothetical protein
MFLLIVRLQCEYQHIDFWTFAKVYSSATIYLGVMTIHSTQSRQGIFFVEFIDSLHF